MRPNYSPQKVEKASFHLNPTKGHKKVYSVSSAMLAE